MPFKKEENSIESSKSDTNPIKVNYNHSFTAQIILSSDDLKERYSIIKNYLLSHKTVKSRISWKVEAFKQNKNVLAKLVVKGKTLAMYIALNPQDLENTKYGGKDVSSVAKYNDVPYMLKISSNRKVNYAKELIDRLNLEKTELQTIDYVTKHQTDSIENLIERELTKISSKKSSSTFPKNKLNTSAKTNLLSETNNIVSTPIFSESTNISISNSKESSVLLLKTIPCLQKMPRKNNKSVYPKAIINIGEINEKFNDGDLVTLEKLKEINLISLKATYIKILAKGTISKALTIKANSFSSSAKQKIHYKNGKTLLSEKKIA